MIHVGLPAPVMLKLRVRAQLSARQFTRNTHQLFQSFTAVLKEDVRSLRFIPNTIDRRPDEPGQIDIQDASLLLPEFMTKYQSLVDLLCVSAKDGATPGRQERYAELRQWLTATYPRIHPVIQPYILRRTEDKSRQDMFLTLFEPASLHDLINSDKVIEAIISSSEIIAEVTA